VPAPQIFEWRGILNSVAARGWGSGEVKKSVKRRGYERYERRGMVDIVTVSASRDTRNHGNGAKR